MMINTAIIIRIIKISVQLRHRIGLTYEAEAESVKVEDIKTGECAIEKKADHHDY